MNKTQNPFDDNLSVVVKLILPPNRVKQILGSSLIAIFIGTVIFVLNGGFVVAALLSVALCILSLCLWLADKNQLQLAAAIFTVTLTIMTCSLIFQSGGIFDEMISVFPSILIIASLFGTRRQFVLLIALIVAFLAVIVVGNLNGWIVSEIQKPSISALLTVSIILITTGFFIYVVANDFRNALSKLNNSERSMRELNEKLEQRVADRVTALRASEAHVQAILDNSAEGILTIDRTGILQSINPAAVKLFGYEAQEVLGKNIKCLMPPSYASEHDQYLSNYHRTHQAKVIGIGREVSGMHKDGHIFPLDLTVSEMKSDEGSVFIGIVRDITARKQTELLKSEFISTVSHELRTPLTSILGALSLINEGKLGDVPPPVLSMVELAHRNGQRLNFLINDILDIEKLDSGKMTFDMQPLSLKSLVEKTLASNQTYRAERGVKLVLSEQAEDALVNIDSQRFMQVISNLLSNALKYSPDHDRVEVFITKNDDEIKVAVKDNGPGIPLEFRSRIFGKFAQADSSDTRAKGGTGLGLSITKKLTEQMNGKIGFDSVVGEGATFYIILPIFHQQLSTLTPTT